MFVRSFVVDVVVTVVAVVVVVVVVVAAAAAAAAVVVVVAAAAAAAVVVAVVVLKSFAFIITHYFQCHRVSPGRLLGPLPRLQLLGLLQEHDRPRGRPLQVQEQVQPVQHQRLQRRRLRQERQLLQDAAVEDHGQKEEEEHRFKIRWRRPERAAKDTASQIIRGHTNNINNNNCMVE